MSGGLDLWWAETECLIMVAVHSLVANGRDSVSAAEKRGSRRSLMHAMQALSISDHFGRHRLHCGNIAARKMADEACAAYIAIGYQDNAAKPGDRRLDRSSGFPSANRIIMIESKLVVRACRHGDEQPIGSCHKHHDGAVFFGRDSPCCSLPVKGFRGYPRSRRFQSLPLPQ